MDMKAIFFDLDGTLVNMDVDTFFPVYVKLLAEKVGHIMPEKEFVSLLMKSTEAMIKDIDSSYTNEEVFIKAFFTEDKYDQELMFNLFMDFYENEYRDMADMFGPIDDCHAVLDLVLQKGLRVVLATNPLFPEVAIIERLRWAGVNDYPFELITTYDNMHACKPQIQYYEEILAKTNLAAEDCMMIGNDPLEDLIAGRLGLKTFLVEDMMIERQDGFQPDHKGSMKDLLALLRSL